MTRATRRATYQDVLDAPAHRVAEIVDGALHLSPRPAPLQAPTAVGCTVRSLLPSAEPEAVRTRVVRGTPV